MLVEALTTRLAKNQGATKTLVEKVISNVKEKR